MSIDGILPHLSYYYDKNIVNIIKELNTNKASYLSYLPKDMINIIINNNGIYYPTTIGINIIHETKYYIISFKTFDDEKEIETISIMRRIKSNNKNYGYIVFVPIVSNYLKTHRAYSFIYNIFRDYIIYPREQINNAVKKWYILSEHITMRPLFIQSSKDIYEINKIKLNYNF